MTADPFRGPRRITDLAELANEYIEYMRNNPHDDTTTKLVEYAALFFADVPLTTQQVQGLLTLIVDRLYRDAAQLTISDRALKIYIATVTRYLLDALNARRVRIFYVLDNELREDRLELTLELFSAAGVFVVTPYNEDGSAMDFAHVERALFVQLLAGRHVAYIERDASVNYILAVLDLARITDHVVVLRNLGPRDPSVRVIESRFRPTPDEGACLLSREPEA
jgi:hypothetical protein